MSWVLAISGFALLVILHEAGHGLVESLLKLGQVDVAKTITRRLLAWDPSDPLGVKRFSDT